MDHKNTYGVFGAFVSNKYSKKELYNNGIDENGFFQSIKKGWVSANLLDKNIKDRFFKTKNGITICFDGVQYSTINEEDFFKKYNEENSSFLKDLKGTYSGFILDENNGSLHLFNDPLSTKNIYYFFDKNIGFVFANKLHKISAFLKKQKISYSVNNDAIYMMALYGFLLEDNTYINEVKKLPYASILTYSIDENTISNKTWHSFTNKTVPVTINDAEKRIDTLFVKAVKDSWSKDNDNKHITLLSGGMDARTNAIVAKEIGFNNISSITFGQKDSKDIKYAREIAKGEGFLHKERFLETPMYLLDNIIENYVKPNDGMIMFHSSAHTSSTIRNTNSTIRNTNVSNYSNLHTGQIGDALFGSFSTQNYNFIKNRGSIGYTGFVSDNKLLDKIECLPEVLKKYQDLGLELFTYEQRIINATIYGDRSLSDVIDNSSPFYDLELINYCLSIPNAYKQFQKIYFSWLSKYHKNTLKYKWDKINMKPSNDLKIKYGKILKKYYNGGKKYFNLNYESMNPYQIWLKDFPVVIETFNFIVEEELSKNILDNDVKQDLLNIYRNNIFEYRNKFAVVTSLLAIKLHFDS
ncbi:7-cyano-7-deazaguanine synthase [Patiriisocius marinistellae]|nr:7-cyano-7-deazaguanine synthase [Patiriisocius marinistellae]